MWGTGLELFALESLSAYVKNIALGVTKILAVDHLPLFFGTPVTMFGSECMYKCPAAPLVRRRRSERVPGALDEFVSDFGFGRRQPRDSDATNLLGASLIEARCRLVSWD